MGKRIILCLIGLICFTLSFCSPQPIASKTFITNTPTSVSVPSTETPAINYIPSSKCKPNPVVVPTKPALIPGYTQLDASTGLHMTGSVQEITLTDYTLKVTGKVEHPLNLSYDDLRCMPRITAKPTLICKGYFEDVATWSGVPLKYILDQAGIQSDAENITLVGADNHQSYVSLKDALREDNFLAYEWEGEPLPILHGFPIRAIIPSMYGNAWVKWLVEIRVE